MEPLAGLAIIALERNDNTTANAHAESIYAALQHRRPGGIVEYIKLLLVCFDIFKHANDPRVPQIVQLGVEILHERASKISKPSQRRSFLRRVASHRRMMALAEE